MGLEVYYPTDVRNALLAAEQAVNAMAEAANADQVDAPPSAFTAGFLVGYRAALTTLALAFGLVIRDGDDLVFDRQDKGRRLLAEPLTRRCR